MGPAETTFNRHLLPEAPNNPLRFVWVAAALVLAVSVALLPLLYALAVVGAFFLVVIGISKPTWAVALVFAAIPLEVVSVSVGSVGLSAIQIVALFAVVLMLAEMIAVGRFSIARTPLDVQIFVWSAVLFFGSIGAYDSIASLKKAVMTLVFIGIYYLVVDKVRKMETVELLMKTLVTACAVVGAYGIWVSYRYLAFGATSGKSIIVGSEGLAVPRAASTVGDPTLLAALMVIALPISVMLVATTKGWERIVASIASVTVLVALGFTFTRGAWIGAAASFVVLLFERRSRNVIIVVAILIALLSPGAVLSRAATSTNFGRAEISHRFDYWQGALLLAPTRPIFGIGLDNFRHNFARLPVPETAQRSAIHAHNVLLVLLSETGLVGFLAYVAFIAGVLVLLLRRRRVDPIESSRLWRLGIASSILGSLVHQMSDSFLLEPTVNSVVWVFAGLAVVMGLGYIHNEAESPNLVEKAT